MLAYVLYFKADRKHKHNSYKSFTAREEAHEKFAQGLCMQQKDP